MFKKFGKTPFDKENESQAIPLCNLADRPRDPFTSNLMNAIDPDTFERAEKKTRQADVPETIIAEGISIKGTMTFQKLIRIDGTFEGELLSLGKLIIGPTGNVKANINMEEAFISGKITGDITVKTRLVLRGRAEVRGNITAPLISVDEGVCIVGSLNISQEAKTEEAEGMDFDHYSSDN